MRALVVYESMYGNTHAIADHIAEGLRPSFDVDVVPVDGAATALLAAPVDLLVVGGPTHAHGLSSTMSRKGAVESAEKDPKLPPLDPDAEGIGLRDWFHVLPDGHGTAAAAFDTRFDASELLTGAASHGIAKRLRRHGFRMVADPESFLVDKTTHLLPGEAERAAEWGRSVAATASGS